MHSLDVDAGEAAELCAESSEDHTRVIGIIQARDASTRLPYKATTDCGGKVLIHRVWDRMRLVGGVDGVAVSTSTNSKEIIGWCRVNDVAYHAGNEDDLLSRHLGAAVKFKADAILRVTADCPFHDPAILDVMIAEFKKMRVADGMSNWAGGRTVSEGLDAEIVTLETMQRLARDKNCPREDFMTYLFKRTEKYKLMGFRFPRMIGNGLHLSVDTAEDMERARKMFAILGDETVYRITLDAYEEVTSED